MENPNTIQANGRNGGYKEHVPTITEFLATYEAGIESWVKAGKMLIVMHRHDRHIFDAIRKSNPSIPQRHLEMLMEFGRESVYPGVVNLAPKVRAHILNSGMRFEVQKKILTGLVDVVTRMSGDKPVVERQYITDLPERLAMRATCKKGNTPIAEQVKQIVSPNVPEPKKPIAPLEERKKISKGLFAVRKGAGGNWIFEKTTSRVYNVQQILLEGNGNEATATIELMERERVT